MSESKTLPRLIRDVSEMEAILWENDGELTPEVEAIYNEYLMTTREQIPQKVESVLQFRERVKNTAQLLKDQADDLNKKAKALSKVADAMDSNLLQAVLMCGGKIDLPGKKLTTRKSESVQIEDIDLIPIEYMERKTVFSPKKLEIKNAIKSGTQVPGAFVEVRQNLNIR